MNTRTVRGVLIATAVLALTIGACKKKPKDDKAKTGDMTADVMKPAAMDAMKPAMTADAMKPAMTADAMNAMKPAGMDAKRPVATDGKAYVITFSRPLKVGLKYKMTAVGGSDNKTMVDGKVLAKQSVKFTYAYEAIHTVQGVHADGKATKEEIKIIKFQMTQGGATKDLLPKDTVVLAVSEGGKEKMTVKGKPVPGKTGKLLGEMVSLHDNDPHTTQDLFGPKGPKKPGDTWKVNTVKMLEGLKPKFKNPALWPKPADVTGTVKFVAVKKVKGMDALELHIVTKMKNLAPKMGPVKATAGTMELTISGLMPADPKVPISGVMSMTMKMHVEGEMKKGGKVHKLVVDVKTHQQGTKMLIK